MNLFIIIFMLLLAVPTFIFVLLMFYLETNPNNTWFPISWYKYLIPESDPNSPLVNKQIAAYYKRIWRNGFDQDDTSLPE